MASKFEPIAIDLQDRYLEKLAACPVKTSDCSFVNLWGWAGEYGLEWAWSDELVWIAQSSPEPAWWPPVGDWEAISDWNSALAEIEPEGGSLRFVRVPESLLDLWNEGLEGEIVSEEDRAQWDYLYDARDLAELKGNKFHKKKNLLNQFVKKYDYTYMEFGEEMIGRILDMQSDWCEWRDCDINEALAAENRVIEKVLRAWEKLKNICGGALSADGGIVAYTLAEALSDDTLLIHFEKGNPSYQGTYQAINQMFVSRAMEKADPEFERVNRMQDLGDKGLRKAKTSYNPTDFNRKYRVEIRRRK